MKKIPALGGKTPRQSIKTQEGRESVEALLAQAERDVTKDDEMSEMYLSAIRNIRSDLGLT